jgi:hypothetical protein
MSWWGHDNMRDETGAAAFQSLEVPALLRNPPSVVLLKNNLPWLMLLPQVVSLLH